MKKGRSTPRRYSKARVYGTLGGWTKALDWHDRKSPLEEALTDLDENESVAVPAEETAP